MDNHYNHFKKIDAHSHIGKFGSPFNIDFDLQRLTEQMEAYNIEKTILCPGGCHLNEEFRKQLTRQLRTRSSHFAGSMPMKDRKRMICWSIICGMRILQV